MTSSFILNDKLAKEKLIGFISDADMDMIAHLLGVACSFILNDKLATEKLIGFINDADMDMIAHLLGVAFGGECYVKTLIKKEEDGKEYFDAVYEFTPNKDYGGEFGELVKGEE